MLGKLGGFGNINGSNGFSGWGGHSGHPACGKTGDMIAAGVGPHRPWMHNRGALAAQQSVHGDTPRELKIHTAYDNGSAVQVFADRRVVPGLRLDLV